jgi:hypothetical protein
MRAQFRQKHLIGGVVAGKTPHQKFPQALFLGTKPRFFIYSLHRCLWLQRPEKYRPASWGKEILPELVTIRHAPLELPSIQGNTSNSDASEGLQWQTAPISYTRSVRITHWVNAVAVVIMAMSGWRIYDASPFFPFVIPAEVHFGRLAGRCDSVAFRGDVGAGRQWPYLPWR